MAILSQDDQRKIGRYTDQHGRKWSAVVEKRTGDPCSIIMPLSWRAPIMPPQNYIKLDPEVPGKIDILYDQWERDLIAADKDWVRRCHETGVELYKDAFNPNDPFNVAILNKIGARPHAPKITTPLRAEPLPGAAALPVQACKAGNLWALGLKGPNGETPKMPDLLHDFFIVAVESTPTFENVFESGFEPIEAEDAEPLPDFLRSATQARSA